MWHGGMLYGSRCRKVWGMPAPSCGSARCSSRRRLLKHVRPAHKHVALPRGTLCPASTCAR
eukprot:13371055-Alexandrium_andersonii.AAC.1